MMNILLTIPCSSNYIRYKLGFVNNTVKFIELYLFIYRNLSKILKLNFLDRPMFPPLHIFLRSTLCYNNEKITYRGSLSGKEEDIEATG